MCGKIFAAVVLLSWDVLVVCHGDNSLEVHDRVIASVMSTHEVPFPIFLFLGTATLSSLSYNFRQ
jgi:hypothetical protein